MQEDPEEVRGGRGKLRRVLGRRVQEGRKGGPDRRHPERKDHRGRTGLRPVRVLVLRQSIYKNIFP